ncbi:gamma-aminobutyraldehyde dehydrogenase [Thermobifida fusca]|uniref:Salicylaldehyde dehydrogenase n=2 Tax=Thermobifida fusca TaxID=2021 RepID=A0A9P2TCN7_THEFU|nr:MULTISPECIES: gamma-aminobutyraldehyde dehydrogenase [Thermobifida]AAZ54317.1 betaine-aldehyde dehydrogenase [Thermobifida fusca YX]EOR72537.1 betaine-aldehyde dehydrogenase [Thermobifida fusca TM51]MBO2529821.1 gamma-aminobutyraldehyde dehydrogenase [Thermobifida sp.]MDD6792956.1 gamma-aminobutyraldehyde dehydrogenase [Thermobifida fusca]PPS94067.1 phenylacetaldehyde dehydrogenase [Thermobifida fusca]
MTSHSDGLRRLRNFINGEYVDSVDGRTAPVVNPATGEAYAEAPVSTAEDVDRAFRAAADAFENGWRDSTPAERQIILNKIADAVEERADELVAAEVENCGKPVKATREEEIWQVTDALRFFAGAARVLEGKAAGEYMADHTSWIRREPIGVVGQITPWNYPMAMAAWKIGPALAAGNTIVLKPSDTTPVSTLLLAEIAAEFLPPGVFNVVTGDRDTGRALVDHPIPRLVSLTGSTRAGYEVAQSASRDLKRLHLELGGKAPVIVFDDADVEKAAEGIAGAGYFNAGQDCTAATRVLAAPGIHDDLAAALAEQAKKTKTAGPDETDAYYGPLNNPNQLDRVSGFFERLPDHAEVLTGGSAVDRPGYFFSPTVVSNLRQGDEMVSEEIFGPVITVQRFDDEDTAVAWANSVKYGLASSVWTKDHARALRVSRRLDFGCVWINTHIPIIAEMPHGGFKHSGYGKDLSLYSLEEYTRIKHVMSYIGRD